MWGVVNGQMVRVGLPRPLKGRPGILVLEEGPLVLERAKSLSLRPSWTSWYVLIPCVHSGLRKISSSSLGKIRKAAGGTVKLNFKVKSNFDINIEDLDFESNLVDLSLAMAGQSQARKHYRKYCAWDCGA